MIDDKEILDTLLYITKRFSQKENGEEKEILRAHIFELVALIDIICAINGTSEESGKRCGISNSERHVEELEKKLNGCWKKHYKMCVYGLEKEGGE